jgi:hypothetical protein
MQRSEGWSNRFKAVAIGIGLALSALTIRHWVETFSFGHPLCEDCRPDFPSLYSGAKLVGEEPSALYDLKKQLAIQKAIDSRIGDSALAFAYPPSTALLLMPLGWLSFSGAFLVMTFVNGLALLLALKLLVNHLQLNREQSRWLWLSTVCNFGVHSTILQGQTSLLILLLVVLFMRSAGRTAESAGAGAWCGALFIKPQLMVVPLLALIARRRWRAVGFALIVIAAAASFSALLVGQQGIADYLAIVFRFSGSASDLGTNPQDMHNLRALAYYALTGPAALSVWIVLSALVIGGAYWLNTKDSQQQAGAAAQWIGTAAAMLLVSPHLHAHDLALLVLSSAWLLKLFPAALPLGVALILIAVGILPMLPVVLSTHFLPVMPLIFLTAMALAMRQVWRSN